MSGALIAQAIGILVMPVISRLFAPEAFGVFAVFTSIASVVSVVACLRYHLAIMLPESDEEAVNILAVSLLSVLIITSLSVLIIWLGREKIISLLHAPQLGNYLWLAPVFIFFQGVFLALNFWNSRTKHFGRLSLARVITSLTTQSTKVLAGLAGFVSGGILIITTVLGRVISTIVLGGQIWRDDKKLFLSNIRWSGICKGFVRFRKFPLIDSWGSLLNTVSWQLPALMFSYYFSASVVGFYALGLAAIKSPLEILGRALSQVFFQKASEDKNIKGNNSELVEILMDRLMLIGILPTAILTMVGEELFVFIFGGRWAEAGVYTQILAPWMFIWFISVPLGSLFSVYERQGAALSMNLIIFATRFVSLYIGGLYQNVHLALWLFSTTGVVSFGIMVLWNIRLSKADGKKIMLNIFKYIIFALPIISCLFIVKYIFQLGTVVILSSVLFMILLYIFLFRKKIYNSFSQATLPSMQLESE